MVLLFSLIPLTFQDFHSASPPIPCLFGNKADLKDGRCGKGHPKSPGKKIYIIMSLHYILVKIWGGETGIVYFTKSNS